MWDNIVVNPLEMSIFRSQMGSGSREFIDLQPQKTLGRCAFEIELVRECSAVTIDDDFKYSVSDEPRKIHPWDLSNIKKGTIYRR